MNPNLAFLISDALPGALHPEHRADLVKSGLSDDTIKLHRLRSVPPAMLAPLLGFNLPSVRSALLLGG